MNGIKKAALFLSSLGYTEADQLLSRLDVESARLIRREIMSLRNHNVSVEETQRLDEEFLHSAGWEPPRRQREHQLATPTPKPNLTTYAPPQRPTVKYNAEAFASPVRSFDFMRNWSLNDVVVAVIDEHPQTIAVVLAHLPQSQMKSVLSALPTDLQRELKRRLDEFEMPDEHIVLEIESALKMRYRHQQRTARRSATIESFDDIETLSDSELSTLFHSVDLTTAMLALIGADTALVSRVTRNFSPTKEHEMRKRLKQFNSVDDEDIEQARQNILEQYNATRLG
jgi:flagellar motor switch protein FliG